MNSNNKEKVEQIKNQYGYKYAVQFLKLQKNKELIEFIFNYYKKHKYMPTYSEMAQALFVSTSTISEYIKFFLKNGVLETDHSGSPRAFRITHKAFKYVNQTKNERRFI